MGTNAKAHHTAVEPAGGRMQSRVYLKNGSVFAGTSFGADVEMDGEVVFSTGMVGYTESLTDPSYAGQILVFTYPLIGNYGVPKKEFFESERIQVSGVVVSEYSREFSHALAKESLSSWLIRSGVPGIEGIDTRMLTKLLRDNGTMLGHIGGTRKPRSFTDPNRENLVAKVSTHKRVEYKAGKKRILLLDCGAKEHIVRSLIARDATVIRVPWDYDFNQETFDGVLISNGPGDPTMCVAAIEHIRTAMQKHVPILGICLGNQLLALAAGAKTYKLPYGHRAHNQPCLDLRSPGRCYITSQNHGYAVDATTLPSGWESWFVNANDGSNEGIRHRVRPWRSVQFHPEATPGPTDTAWIFDEFISQL